MPFIKNRLQKILEKVDFEAVNNASIFFFAFADSICVLICVTKVTSAITEFVDMENVVYKRHMNFEWTVEFIRDYDHRAHSVKKKVSVSL